MSVSLYVPLHTLWPRERARWKIRERRRERAERGLEALITWSLIALIIFHFAQRTFARFVPISITLSLPCSAFQFPSISIFASFAFRLFLVSRFPFLLSCFFYALVFSICSQVFPQGAVNVGQKIRRENKKKHENMQGSGSGSGDSALLLFHSIAFPVLSHYLHGFTSCVCCPRMGTYSITTRSSLCSQSRILLVSRANLICFPSFRFVSFHFI